MYRFLIKQTCKNYRPFNVFDNQKHIQHLSVTLRFVDQKTFISDVINICLFITKKLTFISQLTFYDQTDIYI